MATTAHEFGPVPRTSSSTGSRTIITVLAMVVLAVVTLVGWQRIVASPTTATSSTTSTSTVPDEQAPNRPGGSVYDSQVPAAARDGSDEQAPNRPGGSVYDSQVPAEARAVPGARRVPAAASRAGSGF